MTYHEKYYDADYERAWDALIPKAEAKANRNFGKKAKGKDEKTLEKYRKGWNKSFAGEMERLVAAAGIKN